MKGSYRTTLAGIAAILTAIGGAITALTDNDPATNPDWTAVIASLVAGAGLLAARDNKVTSEDAGAKPKS